MLLSVMKSCELKSRFILDAECANEFAHLYSSLLQMQIGKSTACHGAVWDNWMVHEALPLKPRGTREPLWLQKEMGRKKRWKATWSISCRETAQVHNACPKVQTNIRAEWFCPSFLQDHHLWDIFAEGINPSRRAILKRFRIASLIPWGSENPPPSVCLYCLPASLSVVLKIFSHFYKP